MKNSNRSTSLLGRLHAWLSTADVPRSADLIFVLAGRAHRKEYALEVFRRRLAPRLLFSVGRFEIRRFSKMGLPVSLDLLKMAQGVPPPQRHYFVFFQDREVRTERIPPRRFGTLMEIETLARWLSENPDIRSIVVISSDAHLRRIGMCCRSLLNPTTKLTFLAAPLALPAQPTPTNADRQGEQLQSQHAAASGSAKEDLVELFKIAIYWFVLKIR